MTNRSAERIGRALVLLVSTFLITDGFIQIASPPFLVTALTHIGFPPQAGPAIAVVTLTCALLLAARVTAPFGALLTTAFLGGAICAHVRIGEIGSPPQLLCLILGAALWGGLVLSDYRVRALLAPRRGVDGYWSAEV
ncbi:DoxX family protein [Belnapia sp. F-4-1]|uniref:DoxX family protein n=1 Tax=Belnapia sp. F-4-1 TaxID=1545443 RepID=UPI0005B9BD44|nr:DoxX family protein [Belnapia sp. F-4-1]